MAEYIDYTQATTLFGDVDARFDTVEGKIPSNASSGNKMVTASDIATKADLVDGKVPAAQLPSFVDDVLEYASTSAFPATGESGKIYVALDTNKTYRWGGSDYVEISESLALGETSSTAYAGDKGKANADAISDIQDLIPSTATSSNKFATASDIPTVPTALADLTDDSTHRLVTDTEKTAWNGNTTDIATINGLIPSGASTSNKLATASDIPDTSGLQPKTLSTTIGSYTTVEGALSGINDGKVDKVTGKGLSTNDYDATAKGIVDNIPLTVSQLQGSLLEKFPRSEAEVLGAKNLLNNILTTSYATGIDATVDAEKVVTLNGTATTNTWFTLAGVWGSYVYPIKKGRYIFSSGATIPNGVTINIMKGTQAEDYIASLDKNNSSKEFDLSQDTNTLIAVRIANGTHLDNFTFYPMISFNGGEYQPPTMTNRELTKMMTPVDGSITSDFTKANTYTYLKKIGKVVYFSLRLQGVTANADTPLATIPEGFRPVTMNVAISGNSSTNGYSNFAVALEDGSIKSGTSFNNANINFFATSWITS